MKPFLLKMRRLLLLLLLLAAGVGLQRAGLIDYLADPYERAYLWRLLLQHLFLVAVSMALATLSGVSLGILFTRRRLRRFAGPAMYLVGLGQTIPSLAVLALAMSILGVGAQTAIFALLVYSVLPIARNTLAGIASVDPALLEAARGMGMPPRRILWEVELPNAMRVMLTGFRVALVINIGTAALSYLIGAGGLGDLLFTGLNLMQTDKLLAGALPVILLALLADGLVGLLERVLVPRGLRLDDSKI